MFFNCELINIDYTQNNTQMKPKLLFLALCCATGLLARAQTEKGKALGGGSFSFGTTNENSNSISLNSLSIGPKVGYFFSNNLAVGIEIDYNLSKLNGEFYDYFDQTTGLMTRTFGFKEENFGLAPFVRYYVTIKNNFRFFGQASILGQINSYKNIDENDYLYRTDYTFKGFGASLNPGLAFFPSPKWAIEFSFPIVRYFNETNTTDEGYHFRSSKNIHLALDNFTPSFGVNFHF